LENLEQETYKLKLKDSRFPKVKIGFIGDSGVGKTAIINRFIFGKFKDSYSATIEDFYATLVTTGLTKPRMGTTLPLGARSP
jgi:GTPase SAR1 family protein